jgi:hypothetical protein
MDNSSLRIRSKTARPAELGSKSVPFESSDSLVEPRLGGCYPRGEDAARVSKCASVQGGNDTPKSLKTDPNCTATCLVRLRFRRRVVQTTMKPRNGDESSRSPVRPIVLHAQLDVRVVHRSCSWRDRVLVIPCGPLFRRHRVVVIRSRLRRCGTLVLERKSVKSARYQPRLVCGAVRCGPRSARTHRNAFQVHPVPLHVHRFHHVHLPAPLGALGLVKVLLRGFANHEPDLVSRTDVPSSNPVLGLHKGLGRVRESGRPSDKAHGSAVISADRSRCASGLSVVVDLHSPALEFRGVQNLEVVQPYKDQRDEEAMQRH